MIPRRASLALLALALFQSCASTAPARKLASAGASYGRAIDTLLRVTQETAVDADSARLLSEGEGVGREARLETLEKHGSVSETVAVLERLRRHARLLTRYFESLHELAQGDADKEAADAMAGVTAALNQMGKELSGSPLLTEPQRDALDKLASLAVRGARQRAIARELKARATSIEQQLRIQETVLDSIRRKVKADLETIGDLGLQRDVTRPYLDGRINDARSWIALRRSYLLAPSGAKALEDAGDAASKLRTAWAAFAEGRFDETARKGLLSDLEAIVAFAEAVKAAR